MSFLESILVAVLTRLLTYFLSLAEGKLAEKAAQIAQDKKQGEIDAENLRQFRLAQDSVERRRRALALLLGNGA